MNWPQVIAKIFDDYGTLLILAAGAGLLALLNTVSSMWGAWCDRNKAIKEVEVETEVIPDSLIAAINDITSEMRERAEAWDPMLSGTVYNWAKELEEALQEASEELED